jgi:hypothetical protein
VIIRQIIEMLSRYSPDEELCILWWDKPQFENMDGLELTQEGWALVCKEFDEWENAGNDVNQWIMDSALEYAELVKEEPDAREEN